MGREDLTNGQWARLEPLLPQGIKPARPRVWTRRQLIDGIRWRTLTGAPWRDTHRPLRNDSAGHSHQLMTVTSTFTTGPSDCGCGLVSERVPCGFGMQGLDRVFLDDACEGPDR
ncbi:transposase [Streptomyces sp. NPDC057020]|uniref:transposase n=1 Tax=unclassified Streptomyces TaxID=2593676 RepID=UPI003629BD3B